MKYCFILWTRPEIIKLYSCIKFCEENNLDYFLIHTNQHYSPNMDSVFFDELKLNWAKYNLWINGWNHGEMTWKMMISIEKILLDEKPDVVFVQWDTNTVLAGGLVASKQKDILLKENISEQKIFITWNTIVDAVLRVKNDFQDQSENILKKYDLEKNNFILFTTHRPSNVDNKENLEQILKWILEVKNISWKKVLFPIHPRTKNNIEKFGLTELLSDFEVIEPVWFIENVFLEDNAYLIATDSGWIQEEACILQKKTLILRENTERPETLEVGWAVLVWNDFQKIINWFESLKNKNINWFNPFWDWKSAEKIFSYISK